MNLYEKIKSRQKKINHYWFRLYWFIIIESSKRVGGNSFEFILPQESKE